VKKKKVFLILIFSLALLSRFLIFKESTYFGFDEARDAYTAENIYRLHDLRLIGPPANAPGLFHGPLYWYLLGPLYLLGQGNPYFVSAIFRVLNALGVLTIFGLAQAYFGSLTGFIAAALYAFSFEQNQYAMYVCHPPLAIFSWMAMFGGVIILEKRKNKFWGLPLLLGGAASAVQFELLMISSLGVALVLLWLLRDKLKKVPWQSWLLAFGTALFFLSTYLLAEIKYGFRSIKSAFSLLKSDYNVMPAEQTKVGLYLKQLTLMFHDNLWPLPDFLLYPSFLSFIVLLLFYARKEKLVRFILIWLSGGIFLSLLGSYNAYYVNAGISLGIILGAAFLLGKLWQKNRLMSLIALASILITNFIFTYRQKPQSLIVDMKPQPYMKLADEERVIDKMYQYAENKGFTIRATNIPFSIPTVWAYLFENYALKKFGYLPYWETGPVLGFPGELPKPTKGSTCTRYLIQEPSRGIPGVLIEYNLKEENIFSTIVKEEKIGDFILQTRQSIDKDCHQKKPI